MRKFKLYINYLTALICLLVPKKKNRWVFGAWFGNRISDNSFAFYKYVKNNYPDIECIWICNDVKAAKSIGVDAIKRNSLTAIWKCITARVAVMNQGYLDFGDLNWIFRSFKVQLWHGVPWKRIGEDTKDPKSGILHAISHKTYLFANKCDFYIAPSDETKKVIKTAFITSEENILSVGQPRNEVLMDSDYCRNERDRLHNEFGDFNVIILYMPTFRDSSDEVFSFFDIEQEISPILKKFNAIILEKQHYVQLQREGTALRREERIFNVENQDSQSLLASADVLITDYSSCFFDYLLRDKPIIHFIYDYDTYKEKDRGLYYDLDYVCAGKVVINKDFLLEQIEQVLNGDENEAEKRRIIRKRFDTYESVDNSKIIFKEIQERI